MSFAKPLVLMLFTILFLGFSISAEAEVILDTEIYCVHDGVELKLDIAYQNDGVKRPALVFISGSGFGYYRGYAFDRNQYSTDIVKAANNGYVAVSIDYRSIAIKDGNVSKYPFPSQLLDARSAVRWLRANSTKYHIDADNIGAIGWSSGGNLSLLLGMMGDTIPYAEDDNIGFSSRVKAVVSLCGPVDLIAKYNDAKDVASKPLLVQYLGGTPDEVRSRYLEASPIHYVNDSTPPLLLIYGDADIQVPINQMLAFKGRLEEKNRVVDTYIYQNGGHKNYSGNEKIFPFFDRYLK